MDFTERAVIAFLFFSLGILVYAVFFHHPSEHSSLNQTNEMNNLSSTTTTTTIRSLLPEIKIPDIKVPFLSRDDEIRPVIMS